jgi:hypothetical protein
MGGATVTVDGVPAAEVPDVLLVFAIAALALFSILSIVLSTEDGRESSHPTNSLSTWVLLGRR